MTTRALDSPGVGDRIVGDQPARVALIGTPNSGKTSLFNRLTGGRAKVSNYPGATVERRVGRLQSDDEHTSGIDIIDLPGAYSLAVTSPDETVMLEVLRGTGVAARPPDVLVAVVDATNLRLGLRLVLELRALGIPLIVALNVADLAERQGIEIDCAHMGQLLGATVVRTTATQKAGDAQLRTAIRDVVQSVADRDAPLRPAVIDESAVVTYDQVDAVIAAAVRTSGSGEDRLTERLDRVLLHPRLGPVILVAVLLMVFQAVFAWAAPLMDAIEAAVALVAKIVSGLLPNGALEDLLVNGIIAGVGAVLVFLPQILILFAFILVLEDSGYLPRASFLLDRSMRSAGLSGRSFIPMLSSFACAVPGIMSTRSIPDQRERIVAIFVAPLMACSARIPVYTLLIAVFIPNRHMFGILNLQGLTLFTLYAMGIVSAALIARVATRRTLRGSGTGHEFPLLMELPRYRIPDPRQLLTALRQRARVFLRRVGTVIMATSIVLWALAKYPAPPADATDPAIEYSFVGHLGHFIQPLFAPLGFTWEMSIALIPAMAAREVAVSMLGTVYAVSATGRSTALSATLADLWTLPMAFSFLAWFVYAPQCLATIATVRRETNSRRLTVFFTAYLFAAAWIAAAITFAVTSWIVG